MSIYQKIANVQDKVQNITRDSKNPHFSSTYATYEKVMEVLHPILREQKLMICHGFGGHVEGVIAVTTKIVDIESTKDEFLAETAFIPMTKNDPQMAGSAITYAKRYSVLAMFGLGTEDDDGNSAGTKPTATQITSKPTATKDACPTHGDPVNSYGGHKMPSGEWCNDFKYKRANVHDSETN